MRRVLTLIALFLAFAPLASAALTVVNGHAKGYEGRTLVFQTYADPVSRLPVELASVTVDGDGSFTLTADINQVTRVSVDLSFYLAHIYLEPGARYDVSLPPFRLRPDAERFNPYYEPRQVSLIIHSATSPLNTALASLNKAFADIYYPSAVRLVRRHDKALADKLIARLDSAVRAINCSLPFFRQQANFLRARIFATPRLNASRQVLARFYSGSPLALNVPAYWQTIDMLAPDVLKNSPYPDIRKSIGKILEQSSPSVAEISQILSRDTLFQRSQPLREALIVKAITDAFFSNDISEGRADSLLISAARTLKTKSVRLMAANVYAKKNRLRAGLPAPDFSLTDNKGNEVKLSDFRGRFLYLCFMHSKNYECIKAMPALDNLAQVHRENLDVLCVFTDDQPAELFKLVSRNGYYWKPVSYISNQRIMLDYQVAALPTFFLIAPDGCVAIPQAPGPAENVGPAIAEAIRQFIISTRRGRPEIPRTIYDIANEARPIE